MPTTQNANPKNSSAFYMQADRLLRRRALRRPGGRLLPARPTRGSRPSSPSSICYLVTSSFTLAKVHPRPPGGRHGRSAASTRPASRRPSPPTTPTRTSPRTPALPHSRVCSPCPIPHSSSSSAPRGRASRTWAAARYRRAEIVSSDDLRGVVGSGPHDLDASDDAFALLERIVAARLGPRPDHRRRHPRPRRGPPRRAGWTRPGPPGCPAVAVVLDTPAEECRRRNADRATARSRPPRWPTQLRRFARRPRRRSTPRAGTSSHVVAAPTRAVGRDARRAGDRGRAVRRPPLPPRGCGWCSSCPGSRGARTRARWLRGDGAGRRRGRLRRARADGPPDPDPAGRPRLGADPRAVGDPRAGRRPRHPACGSARSCTPVTFRPAGHHRQGRGHARRAHRRPRVRRRRRRLVGARARGVRPAVPARRASGSTRLEAAIETMRALWAPGTKAYDGERVSLPETTCYPRPAHDIPVIVGGSGERRTLRDRRPARRRAATCRRTSSVLDRKLAVLRPAPATRPAATRDEVAVTVLDLPSSAATATTPGRGSSGCAAAPPAAAFARRTHAGTVAEQRDRYARPRRRSGVEHGVRRRPRTSPVPTTCCAPRRPQRRERATSARRSTSPSTRRATISCWICWVPSKMSRILESRAHFSSSSRLAVADRAAQLDAATG